MPATKNVKVENKVKKNKPWAAFSAMSWNFVIIFLLTASS